MPLNEPQVFLGAGLIQGRHAPGDKLRFAEFLLAAHNTLLAHGRAVQALRAAAKLPARIGTAQAGYNYVPATDSADDLAATRARYFATADDSYKQNAYWLDPMILGRYPEDALKLYGAAMPAIRAGDMETIKQPLDFLGMTLYSAEPGPPRQGRQARGDPVAGRLPDHRLRVGGGRRRSCAWFRPGCTSATSCRSSSPRTACPCATGSPPTAGCTIPTASISLARYLRELARGDRGRRSGRGLLPLVDPRQLRVGRGLQAPLRPGLRRTTRRRSGRSRIRASGTAT